MIAVFLAADKRTLVTRHITHTHVSEMEDHGGVLYESVFFFLHDGIATLATSTWAAEHVGAFIGVLEDWEDAETLRACADAFALETLAQMPVKKGELQ